MLIRGFLERDDVLEARLAVLKHMKSLKQKILDKRYPWEQGVVAQSCAVGCIPPLQVCVLLDL